MGRMYAVTFDNVAATQDQDLVEISPADDKPIEIVGILFGQSSDVGDAAEEIVRLEILRGATSSGSGGGAFTPVPLNPGDAAAAAAAEINNTTISGTGTIVVLLADTMNVRAGYQVWFPPECRPKASQAGTTIALRLMADPADSLTISGTLYFEEY